MSRPDWDSYFFDLAAAVSTRATCPRKSVGCVIVKDKRILATGYNGSIPGEPHCTDDGCAMVDGHCVRTIHAEVNALAQAARHGVPLEGATAYVTVRPCWNCFKTLRAAGVESRYLGEYGEQYPLKTRKRPV